MSFEDQTNKFVEWMQSVGIQLSESIKIEDYRHQNQGRGLKAVKDIKEGEKLFSIPRSALITGSSVSELNELLEEVEEWPRLMVTMMYVAQKHWKPYFDVLPTKFNTPMFWTEEQLEKLKGSAVLDKIGREEAVEMYNSLKPILESPIFEGIDTSEDAFHRMGSLIMAYAFDVLEGDENTIRAMVPPADMLNSHSKLVNARLEMPEEDDGLLEMIATKDIKSGAQIYNFYGEQPNSDSLRRYGYVEAGGNASDVVEISLELLVKAAGKDNVAKWEKYDEAEVIDEAFDIGDQGIPDPDIIAMANLLAETPSKKNYRKCLEMSEDEELSDKAREILVQAVTERLKDYPEVVEELPETVEEVYVDIDLMCKQVLFTEKKLLEMCLGWLDVGNKRRKVE